VGFLTVEGLVAGYSAADQVLKGVDLEVERGEIVSVIGPNGAGKSTLLKVIAGVLRPSRGRVRLGDRALEGRPPREISALGVAFVPQERNVFPTLSVRENLERAGPSWSAGSSTTVRRRRSARRSTRPCARIPT
jgi:ABC-type branched-subunit amino acid transport system ATPase component